MLDLEAGAHPTGRSDAVALGVNCVFCHVSRDGPARVRRSHRFLADKDPEMLRAALNAAILVTEERKAVLRVTNDRVERRNRTDAAKLDLVAPEVHRRGGPDRLFGVP